MFDRRLGCVVGLALLLTTAAIVSAGDKDEPGTAVGQVDETTALRAENKLLRAQAERQTAQIRDLQARLASTSAPSAPSVVEQLRATTRAQQREIAALKGEASGPGTAASSPASRPAVPKQFEISSLPGTPESHAAAKGQRVFLQVSVNNVKPDPATAGQFVVSTTVLGVPGAPSDEQPGKPQGGKKPYNLLCEFAASEADGLHLVQFDSLHVTGEIGSIMDTPAKGKLSETIILKLSSARFVSCP
jgi:TolA-binding protein